MESRKSLKGQAAIECPKKTDTAGRRGQAAIEYLMTYGWAILALVIIIAVLLASGVANPNFFVSEECTLGSNLPCQVGLVNIEQESRLFLEVGNGFAYGIVIKKIEVFSIADNSKKITFAPAQTLIESGGSISVDEKLDDFLSTNSVARFFVNVTYVSCAPEVASPGSECSDEEHTIVGRLTAKVISE
jgi:hypothetical protein